MSERSARKLPSPPRAGAVLQPPGWPKPQGYANGIKARGEMVFVGGMIGWDASGRFADGFVAQARQALGRAYRDVMGMNFPAMALVEVRRLVEPAARLEIEATAVAP
jgi:enamine deaminase RidA (YjgF/YER057c/UK114 family)